MRAQISININVYKIQPQSQCVPTYIFISTGCAFGATQSFFFLINNNVTIYKVVTGISDCHVLQEDLTRIYSWTVAWQVRLNSEKCEALNITNKRVLFSLTIQAMGELSSRSRLYAIWGYTVC